MLKPYKIDLFYPNYDGAKIQKAIKKFFPKDGSNQWIGQAHLVDEFENKMIKKFNLPNALFVNSGSAGLWLAYDLVGIKKGDEVITPVLTCTATNIPLLHMKAKIVFADIDKDTLNISYEDIKRKITKKTKAVVAVALGGIPIDKRIYPLCKRLKIPLIVDAAQSVGYYTGDYVIYSFQAIKHITTCDGGMLVCRNTKDYKRAKLLRWFGIDRDVKIKNNWKPWHGRTMTLDIVEKGYKFQPTDLDALLGLAGLEDIDDIFLQRQIIVDIYKQELKGLPIKFLNDKNSSNWLFGILVEDREALAKALDEAKIGTNVVHLRNDIYKVFGGKRLKLPNMNEIEMKYIYLPLHNRLSPKDIRFICKKINDFYAKNI